MRCVLSAGIGMVLVSYLLSLRSFHSALSHICHLETSSVTLPFAKFIGPSSVDRIFEQEIISVEMKVSSHFPTRSIS